MNDFSWELFLSDPIIFILWGVTAAIVLLWGRGVFCGDLSCCARLAPCGKLSMKLSAITRYPQVQVPFALHERLGPLSTLFCWCCLVSL